MRLILKVLSGVKRVACESDHRPSSRASNNKSPPYGLAASSLRLYCTLSKGKCAAVGSIVHLNIKKLAAITILNDYGRIRSHVVCYVIHS
jgi:hypothetical protein